MVMALSIAYYFGIPFSVNVLSLLIVLLRIPAHSPFQTAAVHFGRSTAADRLFGDVNNDNKVTLKWNE